MCGEGPMCLPKCIAEHVVQQCSFKFTKPATSVIDRIRIGQILQIKRREHYANLSPKSPYMAGAITEKLNTKVNIFHHSF